MLLVDCLEHPIRSAGAKQAEETFDAFGAFGSNEVRAGSAEQVPAVCRLVTFSWAQVEMVRRCTF